MGELLQWQCHDDSTINIDVAITIKIWWFGLVGNAVGSINEVNQRRARLVLGWMTVARWVNRLGM